MKNALRLAYSTYNDDVSLPRITRYRFPMITLEQRLQLVSASRAAASRAFLTSSSGTSYGAAVLTATGSIYQSGQYSSFNHVTNVHAEQAALLMATMSDDPVVLALAVASTSEDVVTRPCGVCRQVMVEHAARIGRNFEVLMVCHHDGSYQSSHVSELLPMEWSPGSRQPSPIADMRIPIPQSGVSPGEASLQTGDHVLLTDGCVALVWDTDFEPERLLVKIKYAPCNGNLRKMAHSFTEPLNYISELYDLGWFGLSHCGIRAPVIDKSDISAVFKSSSIFGKVGHPPGPLIGILQKAGVKVEEICVTGSRAIGIQRTGSDWDLIVPVDSSRLPVVRSALTDAVQLGVLAIPPASGTWKLLDGIFPGGRQAILAGRRYVDTLMSEGTSVAMIFVPTDPLDACVSSGWIVTGRISLYGKVVSASRVAYKRAQFTLEDQEGQVHVTCYHKAAGLLRVGDVVSACGWYLRRGDERRLIQILPQPDRILWWEIAKAILA